MWEFCYAALRKIPTTSVVRPEEKEKMDIADFVWLASYPRSGNTFLRTILWHAFGLRSASVYQNDLGGNKELEEYVGHIEHNPRLLDQLKETGVALIKTHEYVKDSRPAIYVIRDGRAACVSLWEFYNRTMPIKAVIEGQHRFGTWANHVRSWAPWDRPNTLLLKYEQLRDDLPMALNAISEFLDMEIRTTNIPSRNIIASADGRWVKKQTNWRAKLTGENLRRFVEINRDILKKAGYL